MPEIRDYLVSAWNNDVSRTTTWRVRAFDARDAEHQWRMENGGRKVGDLLVYGEPRVEPFDPVLSINELREMCHATFNGGWQTEEERRAFHHGMDTVCNVLEERRMKS